MQKIVSGLGNVSVKYINEKGDKGSPSVVD